MNPAMRREGGGEGSDEVATGDGRIRSSPDHHEYKDVTGNSNGGTMDCTSSYRDSGDYFPVP